MNANIFYKIQKIIQNKKLNFSNQGAEFIKNNLKKSQLILSSRIFKIFKKKFSRLLLDKNTKLYNDIFLKVDSILKNKFNQKLDHKTFDKIIKNYILNKDK